LRLAGPRHPFRFSGFCILPYLWPQMAGLLLTEAFNTAYGDEVARLSQKTGANLEVIVHSNQVGQTLPVEIRDRVDIAFLSGDLYPGNFRGFFESLTGCPNLRWVHVFYVGVQGPLYVPFLERGVTLTNSAGANGRYIAQTAIGGMLMLSRPFLRWREAQARHEWRQLSADGPDAPPDLAHETMVVVGLGAIGSEIARLARAIGLRVIGVRRSAGESDCVDALVPPSQLDDVLAQADWLAIACPLTDATRGLINRERIAMLPPGARILNVARGAIIDEDAMIEALKGGRLRGAYLDVFAQEPLPGESPLWDIPNVIVTPHNSTVSAGKSRREADVFLENLERFCRGEPLFNVVTNLGGSED
jgi:D-2-hydroxyacid dehydrogenase (NADP+)